MAGSELIAVAVLGVNIWGAASGALAARAWWPRHPMRDAARSTKVFYFSVIGLMLAFAGNAALRAVQIGLNWPPALYLSTLDDLFWRALGSLACIGMVYAKLLALPAHERAAWNLFTVVWHPNPELPVARICTAFRRRMRRRKEN